MKEDEKSKMNKIRKVLYANILMDGLYEMYPHVYEELSEECHRLVDGLVDSEVMDLTSEKYEGKSLYQVVKELEVM
jgi:ribosomal protein L11 methylase PrmA